MKVGIAGIGAFGLKHLEAIACIDGVEVAGITGGRDAARLGEVAHRFKIPKVLASLEECLALPGHTRRYNPSHQWIHQRIRRGELMLQQMDVQTYFFRRTNVNAEGQPRSWTDHLLWHHACHTVDLFQYQTGEMVQQVHAMQGSFFRYICDKGTYIARYDELLDGEGKAIDVSDVDVSLNGIVLQDREFFAAICEGREPRSGVASVLPAYETLNRIEKTLK